MSKNASLNAIKSPKPLYDESTIIYDSKSNDDEPYDGRRNDDEPNDGRRYESHDGRRNESHDGWRHEPNDES